jgi:hypothetical protein
MSNRLFVYLSGSVKKGSNDKKDDDSFWSDEEERRITLNINADVQTLNPSRSRLKRNDYYANFGCDVHLVNISDVVLVDARTKKGIGIGAEMMFAKMKGIPVITICPRNSHYRRDFVPDVFGEDLVNWIHPFVFGLSDHIVASVDEAIELINSLWPDNLCRKSGDDVHSAIDYYNRIRETFER